MDRDYYLDVKLTDCAKIVSFCIHCDVVKKSLIVLSSLLLLTATSSMAMSLGRHTGAALIGRPLDMSVQAVLEAKDDAASVCLEADVFYADTKLDRSRIRITFEKSASAPQQALIRIRSTVLIDEPVVTLYLRAGCQQKIERRYVILAELVSESVPDRSTTPPMPSVVSIRPAERMPAASVNNPPLASKPKNQRTPFATKDNQNAAPAKPRLKLEPLDLAVERNPQLKASAELLSMPAANPQERAAASALWRALSAQPQDILRDNEKLQTLENSVGGIQAQSQKTQLTINDLNVKLQQAQADRYANALVYLLVALLLVAMVGLAFLLRNRLSRQRTEPGDRPWWRKNDAYQSLQAAWVDSSPSHDQHKSEAGRFVATQKAPLVDVDVDFDLNPASLRSGDARPAVSANFVDSMSNDPKDKFGFGLSLLQPTRAVNAEELFDVQQQADFFVSIGQHEQAIELLRSHIVENPETSALVYLDLFNLYHQLERLSEYDALRASFNQRFNTQIPPIELYNDKNLGLESYQLALSRIQALWPSPRVLEIIEESLFKQSDITAEAFNLEAYRELLLLYSVAKDIISTEPKTVIVTAGDKFDLSDQTIDSADSRPAFFVPTAIQPLPGSVDENQQEGQKILREASMASVVPSVSRRLGLDIDLSNLAALNPMAGTSKAFDTQFLTEFNADAPHISGSKPMPLQKASTNRDNLLDFDVFDVPQTASEKPKSPKG